MDFKQLIFLLAVVLIAIPAWSQRAIPAHGGQWVHDEAGVLSSGTVAQLESLLKAERDSTSNQIAVLVINSLDGDEISSYANRVFREWKLGQEKTDNGVLFVIAITDRKVRIEVGYGLEGNLTDLISSRIIRNEVAPNFRRGDYETGIAAGTMAIIQAISTSSGTITATGSSPKASRNTTKRVRRLELSGTCASPAICNDCVASSRNRVTALASTVTIGGLKVDACCGVVSATSTAGRTCASFTRSIAAFAALPAGSGKKS